MFVRFAGCNFKCEGWACDTQHAIDPMNICFTGGEPFLQSHADLQEVWYALKDRNRTIEVFTNGALKWPDDVDLVDTFILDWKLPGSGEFPDDEILLGNISKLAAQDAIKFTVKDQAYFDRALENWSRVVANIPEADRPVVWCGPVWGCLTPEKLARWMTNAEVPWNLNIQVHKYVFGADTIGV